MNKISVSVSIRAMSINYVTQRVYKLERVENINLKRKRKHILVNLNIVTEIISQLTFVSSFQVYIRYQANGFKNADGGS